MLRSQLRVRSSGRRYISLDAAQHPKVLPQRINKIESFRECEHTRTRRAGDFSVIAKSWSFFHDMHEALFVVRYIEKKFGPILEFKFQKDCVQPAMYTSYLEIHFEKEESFRALGTCTTVHIPVPKPQDLGPEGISLAQVNSDVNVLQLPNEEEPQAFIDVVLTPTLYDKYTTFPPRPFLRTITGALSSWGGFSGLQAADDTMNPSAVQHSISLARYRWDKSRPHSDTRQSNVSSDDIDDFLNLESTTGATLSPEPKEPRLPPTPKITHAPSPIAPTPMITHASSPKAASPPRSKPSPSVASNPPLAPIPTKAQGKKPVEQQQRTVEKKKPTPAVLAATTKPVTASPQAKKGPKEAKQAKQVKPSKAQPKTKEPTRDALTVQEAKPAEAQTSSVLDKLKRSLFGSWL